MDELIDRCERCNEDISDAPASLVEGVEMFAKILCTACFDAACADAAERQEQDRYEAFHDGGGPLSLDEQHARAWQEKQGLRR